MRRIVCTCTHAFTLPEKLEKFIGALCHSPRSKISLRIFFFGNVKFFRNIETAFRYLQICIFVYFRITTYDNHLKRLCNFCIKEPVFFFTHFHMTTKVNQLFLNYIVILDECFFALSISSACSVFIPDAGVSIYKIQYASVEEKGNKVKSLFVNWGLSNVIGFRKVVENEKHLIILSGARVVQS